MNNFQNNAEQLRNLLLIPQENRDDAWRANFANQVVDAKLFLLQPFQGPDGFPYIGLQIPPSGDTNQTLTSIRALLPKVTEEGYGIVLHPNDSPPAWVFLYGGLVMLRQMAEQGLTPSQQEEEMQPPALKFSSSAFTSEILANDEAVLLGAPSERLFPSYARRVLQQFLQKRFGLSHVGVALLDRPHSSSSQQLIFSIFPEDFSSPELFQQVMQSLGWFLPTGHCVASFSRHDSVKIPFVPLVKPWWKFWA